MKHKTMFNPLNLVQNQKKLNHILVIQNKLICKDTRIQTQNIKKQNTNSMCNKKLYQHRKNLQNIRHYVLENQITKNDLKPLTKGLYPKYKMFQTMFPLKPNPTLITLSYLQ
jgi:hypothetical protein